MVQKGKEFSMGFRRRTRRRALIAGAAVAHHRDRVYGEQQQAVDPAPAEPAPTDDYQSQPQYAPPPVDPADEIEHLAQLHTSGALSDEEFATAKAKALGS
jgi:Short C-terminal domain